MNRDALVRSVLTDYWGIAGQVFRQLSAAAGGPAPAGPLVRLDDDSDRTIYEQIVAQVQEAIATGRLAAGDRLPTVREMADQLGIAPGTVARAYSELERENIVVTQGVRGTRVADRVKAAPDAAAHPANLTGLLRPAAVAAFHMGATADQLRAALDDAMKDIFPRGSGPAN
ncbi:MAG: GntR family transcriptional regulator [Gemmatimonadetes bacterium]|nr:GntR family transcriptional regulator [Gemmatimonadota bacterium]